jgi:hypothetical protein
MLNLFFLDNRKNIFLFVYMVKSKRGVLYRRQRSLRGGKPKAECPPLDIEKCTQNQNCAWNSKTKKCHKKRVSKKIATAAAVVATDCDPYEQPGKYQCQPGTFCCRNQTGRYSCCNEDSQGCFGGVCNDLPPTVVKRNVDWREYFAKWKATATQPRQAQYFNIVRFIDPEYDYGFSKEVNEVAIATKYVNRKKKEIQVGDIIYCGTNLGESDQSEGFHIVLPLKHLVKFPKRGYWNEIVIQQLSELEQGKKYLNNKLVIARISTITEIFDYKDILNKYNVKYDNLVANFPEQNYASDDFFEMHDESLYIPDLTKYKLIDSHRLQAMNDLRNAGSNLWWHTSVINARLQAHTHPTL